MCNQPFLRLHICETKMPSVMYIGHILLLLIPFPPALALPSIQDLTNPPPLVQPLNRTSPEPVPPMLDLALTANSSLHTQNTFPVCNGSLLGFDMNRYSCLQAWNAIPTSPRQLTFGDRLYAPFDVSLPRRFSSRECVVSSSEQKLLEISVN